MDFSLTEKEIVFLRQYATVFKEEREIDITRDPIVVVEVVKEIVTQEGYEDKIIYDWDGESYDSWSSLEVDLMEADYSSREIEEIKEELSDFAEALQGTIRKFPVIITREPVAYFLTRIEADKYCKYQGHNLKSPRVYTRYCGYGNEGDLQSLMKLLQRMGDQLNLSKEER